jgi:hypothetical protein
MTDLSEITEEWSTWSERFLAISQYFRITSEEFEEKSEEGRRRMKISDLNKLAFTYLLLSIDVNNSSGKLNLEI